MRIELLIGQLPALKVERPPELWEAEADELKVASLLNAVLHDHMGTVAPTLRVSNVVVEPPDDGEEMFAPAPGDYVALTLLAPVYIGPDATWQPAVPRSDDLFDRLGDLLTAANVQFAYVRWIPPEGSLTVFVPRRTA